MAGIASKSFENPDELRTPDKTAVAVLKLADGVQVARLTAQPGWSWAECVKPVAGTEHCEAHHVGVVVSGRMHVTHTDGTEGDVGPGEAYVIEPGHDAHVVGDEPMVSYEFDAKTAQTYAT